MYSLVFLSDDFEIQESDRPTIWKPIRFSLGQSFPSAQTTRLKWYSSQSGDFEDNNGVSLPKQRHFRILMQYRAISRIGQALVSRRGAFTIARESITVSGLQFPSHHTVLPRLTSLDARLKRGRHRRTRTRCPSRDSGEREPGMMTRKL